LRNSRDDGARRRYAVSIITDISGRDGPLPEWHGLSSSFTIKDLHLLRGNVMETGMLGFFAVVVVLLYLLSTINILKEYERAVVFRLGRLLPEAMGPGLILIFWPIYKMVRVSLRTIVLDVPPQDIISRDNVSVKVNAIVYFRVVDAPRAIVQVENYLYATSQLAQTTLRSVLGQVELDDLLSKRETLNVKLQDILDQHTDAWGIKISLVEVKQVDLPQEMQRAMAKQAEAEREKRAKIIHADGEAQAAAKLAEAAGIINKEPTALQLRYLQTLTEIGVEKNTTVVFPVPIDILKHWIESKS
jgi:regulator of protease activity HflC (stomatin/prohibitin superfamily)